MQSESLSLDNVQQARYYFHSELCKHDTHAISSNYETTGRTRKILQSREHFHRTEKEKSNKGTSKLVIRKQNDREPRLFHFLPIMNYISREEEREVLRRRSVLHLSLE
ncbi:hypothetical protein T05_11436 [Trichinella murrelli]|uniref:Uncharacterized protein n=1 Tax=Trichinella murrelli TaxID=144512 RepID=A0A0V0UB13_9BILA|nr:hypothetical protein T05_11436 [Trichinella murrelli]